MSLLCCCDNTSRSNARLEDKGQEKIDQWKFALGWCYEYGTGIDKNNQKATEYFQKAAQRGMANALFILAATV